MKKLSGVITALPTPFLENGALDADALKKFVDFQIENGVSALLPVGTTGESPTLSHDEHAEVNDVTDGTRQFHTLFEVVQIHKVAPQHGARERISYIPARFKQFFHDIS